MSKVGMPIESFITERLEGGRWRVTERRADLTDIHIADFASRADAEEWVNWKSGAPEMNPYANLGAPQAAYREKITKQVTVDYTHKKQSGGSGQFARVKIVCDPLPPGAGFMFENKIVGGSVPNEYIPAVKKGLESVLGSGVLAGFPVVDLKVALIDGAYHDVDSSALAFEIASRAALREGLLKGDSVLLELIMKIEVATPEDCTSAVIGDLNQRLAQIQSQDMRGNGNVITAMVPFNNMVGYLRQLLSISQGRATVKMQFDHYAPAPFPEDDPPFRPALGMRA
jgi:elongation factor G